MSETKAVNATVVTSVSSNSTNTTGNATDSFKAVVEAIQEEVEYIGTFDKVELDAVRAYDGQLYRLFTQLMDKAAEVGEHIANRKVE